MTITKQDNGTVRLNEVELELPQDVYAYLENWARSAVPDYMTADYTEILIKNMVVGAINGFRRAEDEPRKTGGKQAMQTVSPS